MNADLLAIVKEEARAVFGRLDALEDVSVEFVETDEPEPTVRVAVRVAEPKTLIGERGQTLLDLQHLLKLMLRKKIAEPFYLSLDVNDYKKSKEEHLREMANDAADEVVLLKKDKELAPMPAAERRVVHMALAARSDIFSESVGEGSARRIVVRAKPGN